MTTDRGLELLTPPTIRWRDFPHVIESQQFELQNLVALFELAETLRTAPPSFAGSTLAGKNLALLFSQPSSRTRASFQLAAERLGARVHVDVHMRTFSSVVKGESLEDTVRMFMEFGMDGQIIRWHEEGAVARAAAVIPAHYPFVNAGDGPGQHPTQALLDVYTIWREDKTLDRDLVVAVLGDLEGRAVRSLVYLLAKNPRVSFYFIGPENARMKPDLLTHLRDHHRVYSECTRPNLLELAPAFDVLYVTRPQLEYRGDAEQQALLTAFRPFIVTPEVVGEMKSNAIILHPLPRNFELPSEIDGDPRARYFAQMKNGLWLRMALLHTIFQPDEA